MVLYFDKPHAVCVATITGLSEATILLFTYLFWLSRLSESFSWLFYLSASQDFTPLKIHLYSCPMCSQYIKCKILWASFKTTQTIVLCTGLALPLLRHVSSVSPLCLFCSVSRTCYSPSGVQTAEALMRGHSRANSKRCLLLLSPHSPSTSVEPSHAQIIIHTCLPD